jgi:hypothetical protein
MPAPQDRRAATRAHQAKKQGERTSAARRQARVRQRRNNGQRVYNLALSDKAVEGFILRSILGGHLTEAQALAHANVEKVISAFVEEEGFRWSR